MPRVCLPPRWAIVAYDEREDNAMVCLLNRLEGDSRRHGHGVNEGTHGWDRRGKDIAC